MTIYWNQNTSIRWYCTSEVICSYKQIIVDLQNVLLLELIEINTRIKAEKNLFAKIAFSHILRIIINYIQLYLIDINHLPEITNLPTATVSVPENSAIDTQVFKVEVSDLDTTDTHTYSATFTPGEGDAYFSIDPASKTILT